MATEVFLFPAGNWKTRRHSGSCGILTVVVLSQGCRGQELHWVLAFKVLISGTANINLASSLLSPLASVFICISTHTRFAGVLQTDFPTYTSPILPSASEWCYLYNSRFHPVSGFTLSASRSKQNKADGAFCISGEVLSRYNPFFRSRSSMLNCMDRKVSCHPFQVNKSWHKTSVIL